MKRRIYTDTSVIGGRLDDEFEELSRQLFDRFLCGENVIVISELTLFELEGAPAEVRAILDDVPSTHREDVEFTEEASRLADQYLHAEVVGKATGRSAHCNRDRAPNRRAGELEFQARGQPRPNPWVQLGALAGRVSDA